AHVADTVDVGAAAELLGVEAARGAFVGNGDHADAGFRVFVAKKGQGAGSQSVIERRDVRFDGGVVTDFVVHLLFDVAQCLGIDRSEVRKVETQAVRRVERASLLDVRAEDVTQRGVDEVRAGVIAHDARSALGVGYDRDAVADAQGLLGEYFVRDESSDGIVRAAHFGQWLRFGIVVEPPTIRHLPARFRVNHRAVEHHFPCFARTMIYAEAGGQMADTGWFYDNSETQPLAEVSGAYYPIAGLVAHKLLAKETLRVGDRVT